MRLPNTLLYGGEEVKRRRAVSRSQKYDTSLRLHLLFTKLWAKVRLPAPFRGATISVGEHFTENIACFLSLIAACFVCLDNSFATQVPRSCEANDVAAASLAHDRTQISRLLDAKHCVGLNQICTARILALSYVVEADALLKDGRIEEARRVLDEGYHHGSNWQPLSRRGDLEYENAVKGDKAFFNLAAIDYNNAINDIANTKNVDCRSFGEPDAPPANAIAALHKRMTEANLLSSVFQVAATRDGECGGVFLAKVRGFEPKATQLPIEFLSDSTTLTTKGNQAAEALVGCVQKFKSIRLSGHADQRGSDSYNMGLSARRLDTIKAMLDKSGFNGVVTLVPMGKREPFRPDDPGKYSQNEIDQMNRRVELKATAR